MVEGCGNNCIKYILFFVNFLFFVMGGVGIGLGIYALVDRNNMAALTKIDSSGKFKDFNGVGLLQEGAIALIVGGVFLFIIGFAGCCGAVKEIKCLLGVYIAIVLLIVIAEIVAASLAIAFKGKVEVELKQALKDGIRQYYDGQLNSSNAFSRAFDFAQVEFDCCGVDNYTDFYISAWRNKTDHNILVPFTCCELKDKNAFLDGNKPELKNEKCPVTHPSKSNPNTDTPCFPAIKDWVMRHANIIIGIGFGIVAIEIIAIVFACCLYRNIY
ncbi:tetraspanin-18-like isoform X2 [Pomacea canaliculata]|nr:tetraspanin-18-like isoform X2 [Pomacea canaliculata]